MVNERPSVAVTFKTARKREESRIKEEEEGLRREFLMEWDVSEWFWKGSIGGAVI